MRDKNLSESFMLRYKVGIDKTFGSKEYTKEMKKEDPVFIKRVNGMGGRMVRWSWVNFQCRGVLKVG